MQRKSMQRRGAIHFSRIALIQDELLYKEVGSCYSGRFLVFYFVIDALFACSKKQLRSEGFLLGVSG